MKTIEKANSLISHSKHIGLVTHKNGDGDAFASLLALARILKEEGKKVEIFSNEELITPFKFLSEKIEFRPQNEYHNVDLLIGLDAPGPDRFCIPEIIETAKKSGAKIVVFDHHVPGPLAEIADVYVCNHHKSSTAELIYDYIQKYKIKIGKTTASLILLGIEMDTNSFQFSNTSPETFEAVAELLKMGARIKPAVENAFGGKSLIELRLLGRVIERLELDKNGFGVSFITEKDHKELGIEAQKSSGMVNFLEQAGDVRVAAVFEEIGGGKIKASLRSNNSEIDVQNLAKNFGGGGHVKASGYEFVGTLKEAIKAYKDQIKDIDTKPKFPVSL
jgi:phosphoesterase RecJ-like protein